jgi:DNA-binding transcriptional ArsR family regulator
MEKRYHIEDILGSKGRFKILKALALDSELTISLLIKKTRLNYTNAKRHLELLKTHNLVQEKKFGRIKIYRYKIEEERAKKLKDLIDIWDQKNSLINREN